MNELEVLRNKLNAAGIDASGLFPKLVAGRRYGSIETPSYPIFCIPTLSAADTLVADMCLQENALLLWRKLKDLAGDTGYFPVMGNSRELGWEPDSWDEEQEESFFPQWEVVAQRVEEEVNCAEQIDADAWFQEQLIQKKKDSQDPARQEQLRSWLESVKQTYEDPRVKEAMKARQEAWNKTSPGLLDHIKNSDDSLKKLLYGMDTTVRMDSIISQLAEEDRELWNSSADPWPIVEPSNRILTKGAVIDLFPVRSSWQLPALDDFPPANNYWGGSRTVHMAILKKWHTEYGAELAVMSGATHELIVSRPPTTREQALKLAVEHYLYCVDCVHQTGLPATIKHRAASILNASCWYFWWD